MATDPLALMHDVRTHRLDNGLRVLTIHRPHLHRAVTAVYVHVGSRHERPRHNGLSHFLEHMLFRGSATLPSAALVNDAVESLGGSMNAATHSDFTMFELSAPPDALSAATGILGGILTRPVFADRKVEVGIVREELLEDVDDRGCDISPDNHARRLVFGKHPLGAPIAGTARNVTRFTEDDLRAHHALHYVAGNMVACAAGPLSHDELLAAVSASLRGVRAGPLRPAKPYTRRRKRGRRSLVAHSASQTALRLAYPCEGLDDPSGSATEMLLRVIDDGMSTRLYRQVCEERGLAYDVSADIERFAEVGVIDVAASVARGSVGAVIEEVLGIFRELAEAGPTLAELDKAKRRFGFDLDALDDDARDLCDFYGPSELFGQRRSPDARREELMALRAEDVRAAAARVLDPSRVNVVLVGPRATKHDGDIRSLLRDFRGRWRKVVAA
jgi:predicted Zn-dependent peptidase